MRASAPATAVCVSGGQGSATSPSGTAVCGTCSTRIRSPGTTSSTSAPSACGLSSRAEAKTLTSGLKRVVPRRCLWIRTHGSWSGLPRQADRADAWRHCPTWSRPENFQPAPALQLHFSMLGPFQTGCGRSDLADECRRSPKPAAQVSVRRLTAPPRNLTFGTRRRDRGSTCRSFGLPAAAFNRRELALPTRCCLSAFMKAVAGAGSQTARGTLTAIRHALRGSVLGLGVRMCPPHSWPV